MSHRAKRGHGRNLQKSRKPVKDAGEPISPGFRINIHKVEAA